MSQPAVTVASIDRFEEGSIRRTNDLLAAEVPMEIRLQFESAAEKSIAVTMRTPGNDFELALGFLYTEGILQSFSDIARIRCCVNDQNIIKVQLTEDAGYDVRKIERNFYASSSCGICGKASVDMVRQAIPEYKERCFIDVPSSLLQQMPQLLREKQNVFQHTGGLHAAALFDLDGNIISCREDIGRHNAVDKIIGAAWAQDMLPLDAYILFLSGRAGFELVQKAAMAGIQVIASVGAPSGLAVELASECDITLAGFVRDNRFNIYNGRERII